jgi:hypothetical protein
MRRTATTALGALLSSAIGLQCSSARYGALDGRGPGVTFPAAIAEGDDTEARDDAGVDAAPPAEAPAPPAVRGGLPDPEPLRSAEQWQYDLVYDAGRVSVERVTKVTHRRPVVTARRMGRYAIELWIGSELIDRVRFDFPLLAAEDEPRRRKPLHDPPSFGARAFVQSRVLVPASARATRAVLVDRADGSTVSLPWPPDEAARLTGKPMDGGGAPSQRTNGRKSDDAAPSEGPRGGDVDR